MHIWSSVPETFDGQGIHSEKKIVHELHKLTLILVFDIQTIIKTKFSLILRKQVFGVDSIIV
jgi:hypothetical protein